MKRLELSKRHEKGVEKQEKINHALVKLIIT